MADLNPAPSASGASNTTLGDRVPSGETAAWQSYPNGVRSITGSLADAETRAFGVPETVEAPLPVGLIPFIIPGMQVIGKAGRGGMGVVYKVYQPRLDQYLAVKVVAPGFADDPVRLARLIREAKAAARVVDARVLPVIDILEYQGQPMILMPFVEGLDLGKIILNRLQVKQELVPEVDHPLARLDDRAYLDAILPILDGVVQGLAAVHRAGILHRDVKPANVMVEADGKVWLTDFGLAMLKLDGSITHEDHFGGSFGYMSPEQGTNQRDVDARADVFSLGATLYRTLTLVYPYGCRLVDHEGPPPMPLSKYNASISADFDALILKALERDRLHRIGSMAEFAAEWDRVRRGDGTSIRLPSRFERLRRFARKNQRGLVAGSVASIAMSLIAGLVALKVVRDAPRPEDARVPVISNLVAVAVQTIPPGASVVAARLDNVTHEIVLNKQTQRVDPEHLFTLKADGLTNRGDLPPGSYLIEAGVPGGGFVQVFRKVPEPGETVSQNVQSQHWEHDSAGRVKLEPIEIPSARPGTRPPRPMALIQGDNEVLPPRPKGFISVEPPPRGIAMFEIDPNEVTLGEYIEVMGSPPKALQAVKFDPKPVLDRAVHSVTWYEAIEFAERLGLRLPTDAEIRYLIITFHEPSLVAVLNLPEPWTDLFGPAAMDWTRTDPPVHRLMTGLGEWTQTYKANYNSGVSVVNTFPNRRVVYGASLGAIKSGDVPAFIAPGRWEVLALEDFEALPGLGFRCARSSRPLLLDIRREP